MRQKLLFVRHVFIFNVIKPLPYSFNYFNNHFQLPTQDFSDCDSHYKGIVNFGKEQSGWGGVLLGVQSQIEMGRVKVEEIRVFSP